MKYLAKYLYVAAVLVGCLYIIFQPHHYEKQNATLINCTKNLIIDDYSSKYHYTAFAHLELPIDGKKITIDPIFSLKDSSDSICSSDILTTLWINFDYYPGRWWRPWWCSKVNPGCPYSYAMRGIIAIVVAMAAALPAIPMFMREERCVLIWK